MSDFHISISFQPPSSDGREAARPVDRGAELRAGGRRAHLDVGGRLRPQLHGLLRHDHRKDEEGILKPGMMDIIFLPHLNSLGGRIWPRN